MIHEPEAVALPTTAETLRETTEALLEATIRALQTPKGRDYMMGLLEQQGETLRRTKPLAVTAARAGITITDISKALGIARTTLYRWLAEE